VDQLIGTDMGYPEGHGSKVIDHLERAPTKPPANLLAVETPVVVGHPHLGALDWRCYRKTDILHLPYAAAGKVINDGSIKIVVVPAGKDFNSLRGNVTGANESKPGVGTPDVSYQRVVVFRHAS
jgi:hypothetical protein